MVLPSPVPLAQAELLDSRLAALTDVTEPAMAGLAACLGRFFVIRFVRCGLGPPHGDLPALTLGTAGAAGKIIASVVAPAAAEVAPAEGWLAPAGADGLALGVGEEVPVPDGVGDGVPVGEDDPEPLGVGDAVGLGDFDGEVDGEPPDGPCSCARHGELGLADPDGAADRADPVLGNAELVPCDNPPPPPGEPPLLDCPCVLRPPVGETTAGTSMATYAPTQFVLGVPTSSFSLRNGNNSNQIEYEALWTTRF